jgi:hypothetical protein
MGWATAEVEPVPDTPQAPAAPNQGAGLESAWHGAPTPHHRTKAGAVIACA